MHVERDTKVATILGPSARWRVAVTAVVVVISLVWLPGATAGAVPVQTPDEPPPLSLEPIDPVIEEVLVPQVLAPVGDATGVVGDTTSGVILDLLGPGPGEPRFQPHETISDAAMEAAMILFPGLEDSSSVYNIHTWWYYDDGESELERVAITDVPQLMDLTVDGVADIAVEVRDVDTKPVLRVVKLPGAPTELTGMLEVTLAPNGWSDDERLAVGVGGFPALNRVTLTDPGLSDGALSVDVKTADPGTKMDMWVTHGDPATASPTLISSLSPVPERFTFASTDVMAGLHSGQMTIDAPGADARIALRSEDAAGPVYAVATSVGASESIVINHHRDTFADLEATFSSDGPLDAASIRLYDRTSLVIGTVPNQIGLAVGDMNGGSATAELSRTHLHVDQATPTAAVGFVVGDDQTFDRGDRAYGVVDGPPATLDLDLSGVVGSTIDVDLSGQDVDRLDLGVGQDTIPLDPTLDGVWLSERTHQFDALVRVSEPRSVSITTESGLEATIDGHGSRPFAMGHTRSNGGFAACFFLEHCPFSMARLSSTPDHVDVHLDHDREYDPGSGALAGTTSFEYTASAPVDELVLQSDPKPSHWPAGFMRCDTGECFSARVEEPPTTIAATFSAPSITWSASRPVPRFDVDATMPRDDQDGDGDPDGAERRVVANLFEAPSELSMAFGDVDPSGTSTETFDMTYTASARAELLRVDTEVLLRGDVEVTDLRATQMAVADPVPTSVFVCASTGPVCVDSGQVSASTGSLRVLAAQAMTFDLNDCVDPVDGGCASSATTIDDMRVRSLGVETDVVDCGVGGEQACGHLWLDTLPDGGSGLASADVVDGSVVYRSQATELDLMFGPRFRAAARLALFADPDHQTTTSGEIACTDDTALQARQPTTGAIVDLTSIIC